MATSLDKSDAGKLKMETLNLPSNSANVRFDKPANFCCLPQRKFTLLIQAGCNKHGKFFIIHLQIIWYIKRQCFHTSNITNFKERCINDPFCGLKNFIHVGLIIWGYLLITKPEMVYASAVGEKNLPQANCDKNIFVQG